MKAIDFIDGILFKKAIINHGLGPFSRFFGRLEDGPDRAIKIL